MKTMRKLSFFACAGMFLLAGTVFILSGCGGSSNPVTSASTATVSLSGTLKSAAGKEKAKDYTGYYLIAKEKTTLEIFKGTVNADGTFSVDVDGSGSYMITVLNDSARAAGVLLNTAAGASDTTLKAGINSGTSDASLGAFTLDETKGIANPANNFNGDEWEFRAKSGVPVSMNNGKLIGKGADQKVSKLAVTKNDGDDDDDGLIDELDADGDGDGTVDELQSGDYATTKAGKSSACIKNVGVFMNLKIDYDKTSTFSTVTDMVITLELIPDPSCVSTIKQIDLDTGPKYKTVAKVAPAASGWTDVASAYPAAGTVWKDKNWLLYQMKSTDSVTRWTVWITPEDAVNLVTAGDSFMFKVQYTDGNTEHFVKAIDYVFTDIPKLSTYNGTTAPVPSSGGSGTSGNPVSVGTGDLTLAFTRPKDETGAEITGMKYVFEIFYRDSSGTQIGSARCTASEFTDSGSGAPLTTTTPISASTCLPTTSGSSAVSSYQIDLTASSTAGDNSAQKFYVKK